MTSLINKGFGMPGGLSMKQMLSIMSSGENKSNVLTDSQPEIRSSGLKHSVLSRVALPKDYSADVM